MRVIDCHNHCFPDAVAEKAVSALTSADRILFGSDSPCGHPVPQLERLLSLRLTDEEKELIAWKNAVRLLGL